MEEPTMEEQEDIADFYRTLMLIEAVRGTDEEGGLNPA